MRLLFAIIITVFGLYSLKAQSTGDSLELQSILKEVLDSHPSVKEASEALNMADTKIAIAKSDYLPRIEGDASFSHIWPVSTVSFPSLGEFQFYPDNNYSAAVNVSEVLYNFGHTSQNIKVESENKNLADYNIRILKQRLTSVTISSFYALVFIQEAIKIKDIEITTLNDHIAFLEKKGATGSSTKYELLTSKVKLSGAQSQRVELVSMQQIQSSVINSLLGKPVHSVVLVKKNEVMASSSESLDSMLNKAVSQRAEVQLASEKEKIASLQYDLVKTQDRPVLAGFGSVGVKNGYFPDLNVAKLNYVVGVSLKIPIYDANKKKNSELLAKSSMNNFGFETEIAKRNVSNEVVENETNCEASLEKIKQFEMQVDQAQEAYNLALINFKVGALTNLDLLDAETSVSQSKLYLLKSQIDYELNLLKLKISLGEQI
jgi:outer membrane protein